MPWSRLKNLVALASAWWIAASTCGGKNRLSGASLDDTAVISVTDRLLIRLLSIGLCSRYLETGG